ncbi:MAG: ParB N-terminal domain-containing protein [Aliishimia sp.]
MAKRRRLEAPSAADLDKIETEFRRETPAVGTSRPSLQPPIAQVAAQAAGAGDPLPAETRAKLAKADKLDLAEQAGLLMQEVAIDQIDSEAMIRDRTVLVEAEMLELKLSIRRNGLRLPIEIYPLETPRDGKIYGLLSGYRRLMALHGLRELNPGKFDTIRAIIRPAQESADAFAAMVEENEVRAQLSHFERGRIAVIATKNGAFESVEAAVSGLFPVASKAKRSKIRSFALIFEELGDMLAFPEAIRERDGLRIATGLRAGAERRIREVLASDQGIDPESEWALIEAVLEEFSDKPKHVRRGGRPGLSVPKAGWQDTETLHLSSGITLRRETDSQGYLIRMQGRGLSPDLVEKAMEHLRYLLEKPDN